MVTSLKDFSPFELVRQLVRDGFTEESVAVMMREAKREQQQTEKVSVNVPT